MLHPFAWATRFDKRDRQDFCIATWLQTITTSQRSEIKRGQGNLSLSHWLWILFKLWAAKRWVERQLLSSRPVVPLKQSSLQSKCLLHGMSLILTSPSVCSFSSLYYIVCPWSRRVHLFVHLLSNILYIYWFQQKTGEISHLASFRTRIQFFSKFKLILELSIKNHIFLCYHEGQHRILI